MTAEDPVRGEVPAAQDEELSSWWVAGAVVVLLGVQYAAERVAEAVLDDPTWLAKTALMVAIEVPIGVVTLLLAARYLARRQERNT